MTTTLLPQTIPAESTVRRIVEVLGDGGVLVPVTPGTQKPAVKNWQHLTIDAMQNPAHLHGLERGNIGVLLGQVSGDLATVDIDRDEGVEPFLCANPRLRDTTRTKRVRGCDLRLP